MGSHRDPLRLDPVNPVLQQCAGATRAALYERGKLIDFGSQKLLYADGGPAGVVLFPLSGVLQMGKVTVRGRRQVMCSASTESCGGLCMLAFGDRALTDVRGLSAGQVLVVPRSVFEGLIHADPVLCRAAWASAASCMAHLSELVAQLSFSKVVGRVAHALLQGSGEDGDLVRLTQAELAAEVGTTREVVARCLATLKEQGLVRLGRGRIAVLDRARLGEIA